MQTAFRNLQKMCLNPKVLIGLAIVGTAVFLLAPHLILAVLPLLFLAACPLSMLLMGRAMMGGHHQSAQADAPSDPRAAASPLQSEPGSTDEVAHLRAEVKALQAQIEDGRVSAGAPQADGSPTTARQDKSGTGKEDDR